MAAPWGAGRTPLLAVGHTRLAGTGPTVPSSPPCCRLLPSCSHLASSNLDTSPAARKACQPQHQRQRVPGVPGAPSWAAVRLFARCSKVSGDFFLGKVGGWMLDAECCARPELLQHCESLVPCLLSRCFRALLPCSSPGFTPTWVTQTPTCVDCQPRQYDFKNTFGDPIIYQGYSPLAGWAGGCQAGAQWLRQSDEGSELPVGCGGCPFHPLAVVFSPGNPAEGGLIREAPTKAITIRALTYAPKTSFLVSQSPSRCMLLPASAREHPQPREERGNPPRKKTSPGLEEMGFIPGYFPQLSFCRHTGKRGRGGVSACIAQTHTTESQKSCHARAAHAIFKGENIHGVFTPFNH